MAKYFLIIFMIFSFSFAGAPKKKHRKWNHKNHYRIHKFKKYPKFHRSTTNINIRYGFHWCLKPWRNFYPTHHHNDILIVRDKKINELDNMGIFAQLEKLGELKVQGLITAKEFQNTKKELLKKI